MKDLQIHITVNPKLFLRNPDSTELGHKIISASIELINELGFEGFNFKKLGEKIGSPESSIYRYFENKQALLSYLVSWYWSWVDYKLVFATMNVEEPHECLSRAIGVLVTPIKMDHSIDYVDEVQLSKIIIAESMKAFHTINVEEQNERGYFQKYKQVVNRVSDMVSNLNPSYEFPHMLISSVIDGVNQQRYYIEHLPSLTDVSNGEDNIATFYKHLVFEVIQS